MQISLNVLTHYLPRPDPTHGQVEFVGKEAAQSAGLAYVDDNNVTVLAVDSTTWLAAGANRKSCVSTSVLAFFSH